MKKYLYQLEREYSVWPLVAMNWFHPRKPSKTSSAVMPEMQSGCASSIASIPALARSNSKAWTNFHSKRMKGKRYEYSRLFRAVSHAGHRQEAWLSRTIAPWARLLRGGWLRSYGYHRTSRVSLSCGKQNPLHFMQKLLWLAKSIGGKRWALQIQSLTTKTIVSVAMYTAKLQAKRYLDWTHTRIFLGVILIMLLRFAWADNAGLHVTDKPIRRHDKKALYVS